MRNFCKKCYQKKGMYIVAMKTIYLKLEIYLQTPRLENNKPV